MIPVSSVASEAKIFIQQQVHDLEKKYAVRIVLAIESGSRAWGFSSKNSDYDVRFIYVRPLCDYLSVQQYRDVVEIDITHNDILGVPFDFNGWDIRKALYLALKSNAVLAEWLQSPITYCSDESVVSDLLAFIRETADLATIKNHYYKLASNIWVQINENANLVKLKHYCYVLRPVLALRWISRNAVIPPMDMYSLTMKVDDAALLKEINNLIAIKATAIESDLIHRNPTVDAFIESVLQEQPVKLKEEISPCCRMRADKLFRKIIGCQLNC